ncbi:Triose-phosphate Transporter [Entomortierella chlamydospora]|uniref:Triose-phosphate Transporter n=1 Tax=Entomortierella chlamydospora TaxID=101097 RepID=A0A9P6SXW9_9FUNG|nr:Triose-phosphate Transporter [Entomortierella chlamydospora]KAG0010768.1 Triose-phosphate Transporter [Entomortierella chlamydospora]
MREGTKLARRLSQQIPKSSSPLNQYIPTLANTPNTANAPSPTTTPSEEKSSKRFSYQQGTLLQQQQQLLHQSASGQDTSVPGPIVTRTAISSPNIAINTSSARNTPPGSIGNARTPLGSILASSLGHAGGLSSPVSPSANSPRHFRYPSAPTSTPPLSASPSINSAATIDKSNGAGGIGSNLKNYTPSVFINIGQTSSSLPQILMPKKRVAQNVVSNLSYIAAWYFFSTALSIYNKNLMGKDNWNFNLPLFVSSIHAGLHFVITACLMHFFPESYDATRSGKGGRITMHSYVTQVVPCAIAAALEICMANASLMYITLSFYTMIKSSTPIWVLVFAFFFRLEKPRWSLILIIGVIVVGVILTVAGEAQFDMTGFILVLLAAVMSGLRWSLTQMLLQKDQLGMDNPVATLYYISPIMFVLMSVLSLAIEDPFVQFSSSEFFTDFNTGLLTMMMAGGGGFLAFAMTVAEFKLIKNTGTVTLSVAGISKEIVVISLSMVIFGDRLTFVNLLGLLVSIGGIVAYNYDKIKKLQHNTLGSGDYEPLGPLGRHHKGDNTD